MSIAKLKACLEKSEEYHIHALDALNGSDDDDEANPAMDARTALVASRKQLDSARDICLKLMKKPSPASDDDQELSWSRARRSSALGRLDRANVGATGIVRMPFGKIYPLYPGVSAAHAPPPPPAVRELGGAYLTAQVRADEERRLMAFWQ